MEPTVIFEDKLIAVVSKPAGMVANEAASTTGLTVQKWWTGKARIDQTEGEFGEKGGVVHRLDKDTSGVMVLAKTEAAYAELKRQFLERKTGKKYVALVHGKFTDKEGEINQTVERHPKDRKKFTVGDDPARMAITEWRVVGEYLKNGEVLSLMELEPHTGRTHQLRVHMQYMHHPIVADPIYGFKKRWAEDLEWCPRLFLHAKYLRFVHPESQKEVEFEAELPNELKTVLKNLEIT